MKVKEFFSRNKNKIALSSCLFLGIVTAATISSIIPSTLKQDSLELPPIKPGEIKFDEDGNLLFPTIIDPENPSGDYEHKIPNIESTTIPNEIKESHFYKNVLNKITNENKQKMFECIQGDLSQEISISPEFKLFVDNIIPNNTLNVNKDMTVEELLSNLYDSSLSNAKERILSKEEIKNFLAFNGINFEKEYNNLKKQNDIVTFGGGVRPPAIPDINTNFPDNIRVVDSLRILRQDNEIRYGFAISYSVILPTLTIASGIASFFTFGISIAAAALDIAFCGIEIANAWDEYYNAKSLEKNISELYKDYGDMLLENVLSDIVENPELLGLHNDILFKMRKYKKLLSVNWGIVKSLISILSITVKIVMPVLEALLLKFL